MNAECLIVYSVATFTPPLFILHLFILHPSLFTPYHHHSPPLDKVGTPLYMSPEVLRGGGYDFSSDVWSVGCLLYELAMLKVCRCYFILNRSICLIHHRHLLGLHSLCLFHSFSVVEPLQERGSEPLQLVPEDFKGGLPLTAVPFLRGAKRPRLLLPHRRRSKGSSRKGSRSMCIVFTIASLRWVGD